MSSHRPNKVAYSHDSNTERHPADDYPTPRGFITPLLDRLELPAQTEVWDPCCGGGHLVAVLRERFDNVRFNDLHYSGDDFLDTSVKRRRTDWVITNPPYKLGEAFVRRALTATRSGVAVLMNTAFLEGIGRSTGLFTESPPTRVLLCNRRMRLPTGVSSTFSHVWLVWEHDRPPVTEFGWLLLQPGELVMPTGHRHEVWGDQ